jgi:hypothetical protein
LIVSVTGGPSINTNHLGDFDRGDFTFRHVATKIAGSHEFRFGGEAVNVRNHLINTFQMAGRVASTDNSPATEWPISCLAEPPSFRQGGGEFKDLKGTALGVLHPGQLDGEPTADPEPRLPVGSLPVAVGP